MMNVNAKRNLSQYLGITLTDNYWKKHKAHYIQTYSTFHINNYVLTQMWPGLWRVGSSMKHEYSIVVPARQVSEHRAITYSIVHRVRFPHPVCCTRRGLGRCLTFIDLTFIAIIFSACILFLLTVDTVWMVFTIRSMYEFQEGYTLVIPAPLYALVLQQYIIPLLKECRTVCLQDALKA